jgi:hypothetical protein
VQFLVWLCVLTPTPFTLPQLHVYITERVFNSSLYCWRSGIITNIFKLPPERTLNLRERHVAAKMTQLIVAVSCRYQRLTFAFPSAQNRTYNSLKNHGPSVLTESSTIHLHACNTVDYLVIILHQPNTPLHASYQHHPTLCHHLPIHHFLHIVCFAVSLFLAKYTLSIHVGRWYISLHTLLNRNGTLGSSMV